MKRFAINFLFVFGFLLLSCSPVPAEEGKEDGWKPINVPGSWESQDEKLEEYNGFAWYRCYTIVPPHWTVADKSTLYNESVLVIVPHIADAYELYINEKKIGGSGSLPPQFKKGTTGETRFKIPRGIFKKDQSNLIAIRVYNEEEEGGFLGTPPVVLGYFLETKLKGKWEFRTGDDLSWAKVPEKKETKFANFNLYKEATTALKKPEKFKPGIRTTPEEALSTLKTSEDFVVDQLLTEPMVAQPLSMRFDERGRLWVVQYRQYPYPAGIKMISRDKYYRAIYDKVPPAPPNHFPGSDRISIHEDTNGDGKFDKNSIFLDKLNLASSVERGRGGIWVLNSPYLLFYPDKNRDDIPDSDPIIHLTGFGYEDTHSVSNNLRWGPDGWLYGAQGSTVSSRIQVKGEKDPKKSVYCEGCAIWRYHPEKGIYEIFAEGGGNAFGIEIDSQGRLFSGHNGSNTRGFHYFQGCYFAKGNQSKYGQISNPYAFGRLPQMKHDNVPRFTHTFVKYESEGLPKKYHGQLFSVDPLHQNIVLSKIDSLGSTFETKDIGIPLQAENVTFRPVDIQVGPDGAIYIADFCEQFIAHGQHFLGEIDPESGRVYRLRGKNQPFLKSFDLNKLSTDQLVDMLESPKKWYRQTALRLIADRQDKSIVSRLQRTVNQESGQIALESFWALNQLGQFSEISAPSTLFHANPSIRLWTVRLLCDKKKVSSKIFRLMMKLASRESNPEVKCQLAASAIRLPVYQCLPMVKLLIQNEKNAEDRFIPMILWWGLSSKAQSDRENVLNFFMEKKFWSYPVVKSVILERLIRLYATSGTRKDFVNCTQLLNRAPDKRYRKILMKGFEKAFSGRSASQLPVELIKALSQDGGGSLAFRLRTGDKKAIDKAIEQIKNPKTDPKIIVDLVNTFGEVSFPQTVPVMLDLLTKNSDTSVQSSALTALQKYKNPEISKEVIKIYSDLNPDVQLVAQTLLVARKEWAVNLLEAIDQGTITPQSIPLDVVRKMTIFQDDKMSATIHRHWKNIGGSTTAQMQNTISKLHGILKEGSGDAYQGRELFLKHCGKCHVLFHEGGRVGPDLTSHKRTDVLAMLLNIVNPSAEIREGYEPISVLTTDGRAVTGFRFDEDQNVLVIRGIDGQNITLSKEDIDEIIPQKKSVMPEGILENLTVTELKDLFSYLKKAQPIK